MKGLSIKNGDTITPTQYYDMVRDNPREKFYQVTQDIYDLVTRVSDDLPDYEGRWVRYCGHYGGVIPTTLGDEACRAGVGAVVSDSRWAWSVQVYGRYVCEGIAEMNYD